MKTKGNGMRIAIVAVFFLCMLSIVFWLQRNKRWAYVTVQLTPLGEGEIVLEPPQPPGGYPVGTVVQATAVPATDWVFRQWIGGVISNLEWDPSQPFVATVGPTEIMVEFSHRPGLSTLDLLPDFGAYLVAIGFNTLPEEVEAFDYDMGAMERDGLTTTYSANGIPDAAEFMALQTVLESPNIHYYRGGVSHEAVWAMYEANLAQVQTDLSAQSAAVQRAVAAYMTLGTFGHEGQVAENVATHFSVTLDLTLYRNSGNRWFAADADMDEDDITNLKEWNRALAEASDSKSATLAAAGRAYAAAVISRE